MFAEVFGTDAIEFELDARLWWKLLILHISVGKLNFRIGTVWMELDT